MKQFIEKIRQGHHLLYEEMTEAARQMFSDEADHREIAELLIALSEKGETAYEVAALSSVMKSYAATLQVPDGRYIDNCGTGGDGSGSFNISTTAAFVLAGAGLKVAKHGNRKISSVAGSQDVLDALGIRSTFTSEEMMELLEEVGITFLFAPTLHPKMANIGEARKLIGKPTVFNLVGPLTNPLPLQAQFTGISRRDFIMDYALVLRMIGRERAVVVSGAGGMDEASLAGQNAFVLIDRGDFIPFSLTAEDVGLPYAPLSAIRGGNAKENAEIVRSVLRGERGPRFDTVVFNAGIALFAEGAAVTFREGVEMAIESILSGNAMEKLEAVVAFSDRKEAEVVVK
ncbi:MULTISPECIES: anthranilate phosphoribosyltransferase [Sporosarcina]|uniref:Anthranilate phosphoribosyltransferase n=1 Tax=Sporosarcina contaminans TaxID=633403 RepID=A0ABW3TWC6_9BACL